MRAELALLHRQIGTTFVYVTHDQVEAMTMSDRVAVMFDGRFEQIDTPERIYAQPATLSVAQFIGAPRINCIAVQCRGGIVELGHGQPSLVAAQAHDGPHHLCFRPEAVSLERRELNWAGTVQFIEDMGAELHVHVGLPGQAAPVIARAPRRTASVLALGRKTVIGVDAADLLLFGPQGGRVAIENGELVYGG